jgi:membrane-associated protease RseP (regulator of RpoE activity)
MNIASESSTTILIVLVALGLLVWGFSRAKPYGKLGVLAWLQSSTLMLPWLIFFSLVTVGINLNLVSILFLFVAATGLYIVLGQHLRAAGQDQLLRERAAARLKQETAQPPSVDKTNNTSHGSDSTAPVGSTELAKTLLTQIPEADVKAIQGIFGIDTFFVTTTLPYQDGLLFRGNLRGEADTVFARLSQSLQERLGNCEAEPQKPRYRLFLLQGPDNKPVAVVLPSRSDPKPLSIAQKLLAVGLAIATLITCAKTAGLLLGFDLSQNWQRVADVLPLSIGLLIILAAHEIGHQVLARHHQVRLSWPFLIPTWQIGSFGAINRFESWLPNRKVLFDVAFAGPASGGIISLGMLVLGLILSNAGSVFSIPTVFFQGSILVGTLAKTILGSALHQDAIAIHPLVVIGWLGLVINALNLMPAGQLDGGRIVQAIYGRKVAGWTTVTTIIVLSLVSLVNPLALYWAVVILFLQRGLEIPSFDELSDPNDTRAALGLLALFLMIATLIPLTPSLAGRLGIGG